jgi:hypothetical protein
MSATTQCRHSLATRWVHAGLSLAVAVELSSGLIMQAPYGGHPVNLFYKVHEASNAATLGLAGGFWVVAGLRRGGTDLGALVPWFSPGRMTALVQDARAGWRRGRRQGLPHYRESAPVTAALRGALLGLITLMALCGVLCEFLGNVAAGRDHVLLSGLVWVFLIGHLLLALVHHYGFDDGISEMWQLGSDAADDGPARR